MNSDLFFSTLAAFPLCPFFYQIHKNALGFWCGPPQDWTFTHKKDTQEFNEDNFNRIIATSPKAYRLDQQLALNEYRERAGLKTVATYENDEAIQQLKNKAGL